MTGSKTVRRHEVSDEYHSRRHVQPELRDSKSILSEEKKDHFYPQTQNELRTETVAAISAPTPPVIGAS